MLMREWRGGKVPPADTSKRLWSRETPTNQPFCFPTLLPCNAFAPRVVSRSFQAFFLPKVFVSLPQALVLFLPCSPLRLALLALAVSVYATSISGANARFSSGACGDLLTSSMSKRRTKRVSANARIFDCFNRHGDAGSG